MNRRTKTALIVLLLFFASWLPRVLALDSFVTIDERKWLARSANFYRALTHGDFANTFQREHPGVTVMWAGTLGFLTHFPTYAQEAPGYFGWDHEEIETWLKANTNHTPLELLAAGRWWVVLGVSLLLAVAFLPLRRLLGDLAAALAVLFVAWMPWAVALSRQLHPDGYVSSLIFVALVFFLGWLYGGRKRSDLVISGVIMGLAWLTKTPAAFLVPTGAILIALEGWRLAREKSRNLAALPSPWRSLLTGYVVWGAIAVATFFVLWPSMWVNPLGSLLRMANEMEEYVVGHVNPNYFMGQITDDPGLLLYPIAYLFRSTPATLLGLLFAASAAWRRSRPFDQPTARRTAFALTLFALLFVAFMEIPAKKFDRYILPAFLALDVVAALGWVALGWAVAAGLARRGATYAQRHATGVAAAVMAGGLLLLHGLFTGLHYPYYLTYFNPLLGGGSVAPKVLIIGWGEGLDGATTWLNQQPDAADQRVAAWYADGPVSYLLDGTAVSIGTGSPASWLNTDYAVIYINQVQRQIPSPEVVDFFLAQTPAYTMTFGGLDLARVYDLRTLPFPPFTRLNTASSADFGDAIRLLAYEQDKTAVAPGEKLQATLYLVSRAPMPVDYNILLRLVGADGSEHWRAEGWPWGSPTSQWPLREVRPDGHTVEVPASIPPGLYKLVASIYDPETFDPLPVQDTRTGALLDANQRDVALIQVGTPAAAAQTIELPWRFGETIALHGTTLPPTATAGSTLQLALAWESLAATPTDYTVFVHVVDADGQPVAQQDRPPLAGFAPTHLWTTGLRVLDDYAIPLPPDLKPGRYEIRTGLYTSDDGRLPVTQDTTPQGDYAVAGAVEIQ